MLKNFLISNKILITSILYLRCGNLSKLLPISASNGSRGYRFTKKGCQKSLPLFHSTLPLTKVARLLCCFQLSIFFGISNTTIAKYKSLLLVCYKDYLEKKSVVLGGCGIIVEVDESVLSRKGIIRNPAGADDTKDTVWILGGIDRTEKRNFFLCGVTGRTIGSLTVAMMPNIKNDSILFTEGHPSAAQNLNFRHQIINHTEGFRSEDGTHTNNIEGFWGHKKNTMKKENGVFRDHIDA